MPQPQKVMMRCPETGKLAFTRLSTNTAGFKMFPFRKGAKVPCSECGREHDASLLPRELEPKEPAPWPKDGTREEW